FTFLDYSIYTIDGEWGFTTTFYDTPPGLGNGTFLRIDSVAVFPETEYLSCRISSHFIRCIAICSS
ncbi:26652_t:CDS:1, partial [Gigaspora margarita]